MKKILYTKPDGGIAIVHPVRNTHPEPETLTDDEILKRAWKDVPADAINAFEIDESAVPADRTFRNAWAHCPVNGVRVDMEKARALQQENLRFLRKPKMLTLDVQYMKALERGDSAAMSLVATEKQALRDVTDDPRIAAASTAEELKQVMPEVLK